MAKKTRINKEKYITPSSVLNVSKKLVAGELKISGIINEFSYNSIDNDKSISIKDLRSKVRECALQELTKIFGDRFNGSGVTQARSYHISLSEGEDVEAIVNAYYGIKPKTDKKVEDKPKTEPNDSEKKEKLSEIENKPKTELDEPEKKEKLSEIEKDPNYILSNVENYMSKSMVTIIVLDIIADNGGNISLKDLENRFSTHYGNRLSKNVKRFNKLQINQVQKIVNIFRTEFSDQLIIKRVESPENKYEYSRKRSIVSITSPCDLIIDICESLINHKVTDILDARNNLLVKKIYDKYIIDYLKKEWKKDEDSIIPKDPKTDTVEDTLEEENNILQKPITIPSEKKTVVEVSHIPVENTIPELVWKTNKELFAKICVVFEIACKSFVSTKKIKEIAEKLYFIELDEKEILLIIKTIHSKGIKINKKNEEIQIIPEFEIKDFDITKTERRCLIQTPVDSAKTIEIFGKDKVNIISEGNYFIKLDYTIDSSKKLCNFYMEGEFTSLFDEMLSTRVGYLLLLNKEKREEVEKRELEEAKKEYEDRIAKIKAEKIKSEIESINNMFA